MTAAGDSSSPSSGAGRSLHLWLLALQVLLVLLPTAVLAYVLWSVRGDFRVEHAILLVCTLVLLLAGLLVLRRVFERISSLAKTLADAARAGARLEAAKSDARELREITSSFNGLVDRFEEAARQLDRKVSELTAIRGLVELSSKSLGADHLLTLLLEEAMALTSAGVGSVLRVEEDRRHFRLLTARGFSSSPESDALIPFDECLSRLVVDEGATVVVEDIETDPRTMRPNDPRYSSPSFMLVPVTVGGELRAVLNLACKADDLPFDAGDREVTGIMIGQVSVALESAEARFEAQEHLASLERRTRQLARANEALTREIGERRQVQEILDATNAFLRNLLDSSVTVSIVSTDLDGTIRFWNSGAANIFGWQAEEVVGSAKIGILYPDDETHRRIERVKERIVRERRPATTLIREVTRDGRLLWVNLTTCPRFDEDGRLVGLLGIGEDVTQRRDLEEQLLQAQKAEAIGTLAGGIAHDFNNLLMGIQGTTSLLLLKLEPGHPHREHIEGIEQLVGKAAGLTQQLLAFARGGRYEPRPLDVREVLSHSLHIFARSRKDIDVQTGFAPDTPTVEGDRGQLEQVFLNLFLNAGQAMPGGGRLVVRTEEVDLGEDYVAPLKLAAGPYVRITVTDTGQGIAKEHQRRIFDPFYTTRAPGAGTGLGLASAYGIVRNHRGIVKVYSEEGHGATFSILLPASGLPLPDEETVSGETPLGTETVLLVDDEPHVLRIGAELLRSLGYTVLDASSGAEALAIYGRRDPPVDAVVLDMIMPGMNGGATFDALHAIDADVRVLLASGYSVDGAATDLLRRGCAAFIQKPFARSELARKLRDVLASPPLPDS